MVEITRKDAIQIIDNITDRDDPYWSDLTDKWYNKTEDKWPTLGDVLKALGVTAEEYKEATGFDIGN